MKPDFEVVQQYVTFKGSSTHEALAKLLAYLEFNHYFQYKNTTIDMSYDEEYCTASIALEFRFMTLGEIDEL